MCTSTDYKKKHFSSQSPVGFQNENFLYFTVTTEKAAKHIPTSVIRKWPHRETFSVSSSCCMNLWIRGKGA